jgi:hypothetical protein
MYYKIANSNSLICYVACAAYSNLVGPLWKQPCPVAKLVHWIDEETRKEVQCWALGSLREADRGFALGRAR